MAREKIIGLAAHVDAGKTTLSEAMLYLSGAVRRQGRVDHGDAFLDTEQMEKERGITIFSKEARLTWKKTGLTLVDTPGHTDFAGETERAVSVLDAAVLVISATEGIQPHTRTLWKLLEKNRVPVILFINKMDRCAVPRESLMEALARGLSDRVVDFSGDYGERIALTDETVLDIYLREGELPWNRVSQLVRERRIFPCFFGAALRNEGVTELMDFLADWELPGIPEGAFGARVYRIRRDPQGNRLVFLKITGGSLQPRDAVSCPDGGGGVRWTEKAAEIRLYSGSRYVSAPRAEAGQLCCVTGLSRAVPGDGLGAEPPAAERMLEPCFSCRLILPQGTDPHTALRAVRTLEEEEPLLRSEYIEARREIRIQSMGDVYLEVLKRQLKDRFGLDAAFGENSVLYRETITREAEGVGHYEPLRHYAEVHLLLVPLPRGSGLVFESAVSSDDLATNWQRLILTHLAERTHPGVLTGSPVTDMKIVLVNGRAHLKHTEGGDFRQATYRAVRQGLMRAGSVLLEPWSRLEAVVPEEQIGRVMTDLTRIGGQPGAPEQAEDGLWRIAAEAPAGECAAYLRTVRAMTRGQGQASMTFTGYRPCARQEEVIAERGYDPLRDVMNPPDSVFCAHGAGYTVAWNQVEQFMHLPSWQELKARRAAERGAASPAPAPAAAGRISREEDEELARIFERTYGPVRSRQLMPVPRAEAPAAAGEAAYTGAEEGEILLVDGYNVLFAWEEWKDQPVERLDAARGQLTDLLCDYAGATGKTVILVFDAYRVKRQAGSAEKYSNIYVVYTREAQTADAYIEKFSLLGRGRVRIRVITSDRPEQLIAVGNAAMRTSAREFREEVIGVRGSIAEYIARHNRPGSEKAMERAYKEAWVRRAGERNGKQNDSGNR